jgi:hypothetical protein
MKSSFRQVSLTENHPTFQSHLENQDSFIDLTEFKGLKKTGGFFAVFGGIRRAPKHQAPSTKLQRSSKSQAPNQSPSDVVAIQGGALRLGAWNFSGAGTHPWWAVLWKKLSSRIAKKWLNRIRFMLLVIKSLRKEFLKSLVLGVWCLGARRIPSKTARKLIP